jgi:hypothetical protein
VPCNLAFLLAKDYTLFLRSMQFRTLSYEGALENGVVRTGIAGGEY